MTSRDPYLLGSFSTRKTRISWRAKSGHADRVSAWSREGTSPPAPPEQVTHRGTRAQVTEVEKPLAQRGGWGWGEVLSRGPYLLGRFSTPQTKISWRATSGHADRVSAWSREGISPQPRPGKLRYDYPSAARDAAALARRASTADMGTAGEPRVAARTLGPWKSEPPVATRSWSWQICTYAARCAAECSV